MPNAQLEHPYQVNREYGTEKGELMYKVRKVFFFASNFDTKIRINLEMGRVKIYQTYDPISDLGDGWFKEHE